MISRYSQSPFLLTSFQLLSLKCSFTKQSFYLDAIIIPSQISIKSFLDIVVYLVIGCVVKKSLHKKTPEQTCNLVNYSVYLGSITSFRL